VTHLVGVDVGGTFTDVLLMPLDGGPSVLAKVPTTPEPAEGVVRGILEAVDRAGVDPASVRAVLHGTTIATNTVLEGKGARVGLLVTKGFRYVLEIARSWTPGPISGWIVWDKPAPLVDVRDVREVRGRASARGEVMEPFDPDEVTAAVRDLERRGVEAMTVSLVNGYARPALEAELVAVAHAALNGVPLSASSDVLPEFREYERTLAAVANAYVQPAMMGYAASLGQALAERLPGAALHVVRSDGGLMTAGEAGTRPIETVLSGPAGGVRAAVFLGELTGHRDVLSFDMGGTSTDVALNRDAHPAVSRTSPLTDYFRVRVPSLDVVAIGAGGGSIAHVPMTGALRVGPESAGSQPGPACYGRGGDQATVTDANVVLGYLRSLLGGRMELHPALAARAVGQVADRLGVGLEDAAGAIVALANEKMLSGLRLVSVQRGHDPRGFALVAFGGAGPLHANALMELLGSPVAIVPLAPGVFSTFGFLVADMQREFATSHVRRLADVSAADLAAILGDLEASARGWLEREGFGEADQRLVFQFGMRYYQQGFELPVTHPDPFADPDLGASLAERFVAAHARLYGFELELEPELVVVRCVATGLTPSPAVHAEPPADASAEQALVDGEHRIYWEGAWVDAPAYARERLGPGHVIAGPAVIEQTDSTTLVHPRATATVDAYRNLVLRRETA
jgi:N-methylhydantoinase A